MRRDEVQLQCEFSRRAAAAQIERRFLTPTGVTPRLEYRVTTPVGRSAVRNAEITRDYWDSLDEAASVPVFYVLDEPKIGRATSVAQTRSQASGLGLAVCAKWGT